MNEISYFPTAFVITSSSFLLGCYGIWVTQGCNPIPPFISQFADRTCAQYFQYSFALAALCYLEPTFYAALKRRAHARSMKTNSPLVDVLTTLFFISNVIAIFCCWTVIYFPWNGSHAPIHFVAAVLAIVTFQAAHLFHIIGTVLLRREHGGTEQWSWNLRIQVMVASTPGAYLVSLVAFMALLSPHPNMIHNLYLLTIMFLGTKHVAASGHDEWQQMCVHGGFTHMGLGELQYFEHCISVYEWLVTVCVAIFIVLSTQEPPPAVSTIAKRS